MSAHQFLDIASDPKVSERDCDDRLKDADENVHSNACCDNGNIQKRGTDNRTLLSHWYITKSPASSPKPMLTPDDSPKSQYFKESLFSYFQPVPTYSREPLAPLFSKNVHFSVKPSSRLSPLKRSPSAKKKSLIIKPSSQPSTQTLDPFVKPLNDQFPETPAFKLPTVEYTSKDAIPRIDSNTLARLLKGEYDGLYSSVFVIDARFWYEYEGGHISGAISCPSTSKLDELFFSDIEAPFRQPSDTHRTAIVIHCEFSSHRAPALALYLRKKDRALNQYPILSYPELYILQGGYCEFFRIHSKLCMPSEYIPMNHIRYRAELKVQMKQFRVSSRRLKSKSCLASADDSSPVDSDDEEADCLSLSQI